MADTEPQNQEHRCSLCPEEQGPPQPNLAEAAHADLRCGHQVHTHCLLNFVLSLRLRRDGAHIATCPTCDVPLLDTETVEYYENLYEDNRRPERRKTVKELWETNAEFKSDIKKYKKMMTEYNKAYRVFNKDARVVLAKFRENVDTSVQLIKDQKRVSKQEFNRIPSKRSFMAKSAALTRLKNQIRASYTISFWDIADGLKEIDGAPNISRNSYFSWRFRTTSFFRIRI